MRSRDWPTPAPEARTPDSKIRAPPLPFPVAEAGRFRTARSADFTWRLGQTQRQSRLVKGLRNLFHDRGDRVGGRQGLSGHGDGLRRRQATDGNMSRPVTPAKSRRRPSAPAPPTVPIAESPLSGKSIAGRRSLAVSCLGTADRAGAATPGPVADGSLEVRSIMGSFSIFHWLLVLVVILILFGAGRLPSVMGGPGQGHQGVSLRLEGRQRQARRHHHPDRDRNARRPASDGVASGTGHAGPHRPACGQPTRRVPTDCPPDAANRLTGGPCRRPLVSVIGMILPARSFYG